MSLFLLTANILSKIFFRDESSFLNILQLHVLSLAVLREAVYPFFFFRFLFYCSLLIFWYFHEYPVPRAIWKLMHEYVHCFLLVKYMDCCILAASLLLYSLGFMIPFCSQFHPEVNT